MKKFIIYLICVLLFFQDSIFVYASEVSDVLPIESTSEDIKLEEKTEEDTTKEEVPEKEQIEDEQMEETAPEEEPTEGEQTQETAPEEEPTEGEQTQETVSEEEPTEVDQTEETVPEDETPQDEQLQETVLKEDITEDAELEEAEDDPQAGRAMGYLDEGFGSVQFYSDERYHVDRYKDYQVRDVIDVSKHQGAIDWNKVKQSGIDYAIIRAGYRGYGQSGTLNTDSKFHDNIKQAISVGIDVGVYFFSQAITEEEAVEEANYALSLVEGYPISLPIAIDFEYASDANGLTGRLYNARLSREKATRICRRFCETVESRGYSAMIYANKSMLEKDLNAGELENDYQIWLAHYANETSYAGKYDFWQYTSTGRVSGISGNVDKSFWYIEPEASYVQISENIYTIASAASPNYVIDIPSALVTSGIAAQVYEDNGTWAQKFYIRPEGGDSYIIMSANSGKVLELRNNRIYQSDYNGKPEQQWKFRSNEDGSYGIESVSSGQLVTLENGAIRNGTQVFAEGASGKEQQHFRLKNDSGTVGKSIRDGVYYIESQLCADKMWNLTGNGQKLEIRGLGGGQEQKFQIRYAGNGCYQITNMINGGMLTANGSSGAVFTGQPQNAVTARWIFKRSGQDVYTIISAQNGNCLDVLFANSNDGTSIQTYTSNDSKAQLFKVYETSGANERVTDGVYVIHSALSDDYVVDVSGASMNCDANVQLYQKNGTAAQKFAVKQQADGTYQILSVNSGMAVSVQNDSNDNMANVLQYFPTDTAGQRWKLHPKGKGYFTMQSAVGGKVLDVKFAEIKNEANIQVYENNGTMAQKFRFEKVGELPGTPAKVLENGTYRICSALDESKVIDIQWASIFSGGNAQLYSGNGTSAQKFVLRRDNQSGLYSIVCKRSGMALSYEPGTVRNMSNVYQNHLLAQSENQWRIKHVAQDYYMIYAKDTPFCLDISGAGTADGTNVQLYLSNGTKAQIFKIVKESDRMDIEQDTQSEFPEGLYTIASVLDERKTLDIEAGSVQDRANVQLYDRNNTNAQKFFVEKAGNGTYKITVMCSGKLLTENNWNVCQMSDQNSASQRWKIIPAGGNEYMIQSQASGNVLDVRFASTANGTNIQTYSSNFTAAQHFKMIPTTSVPTAEFVSNGSGRYGVSFKAFLAGNVGSADGKYYLMEAANYGDSLTGSPLASVDKKLHVSMRVNIADKRKLKEIAMGKLALAVKEGNGSFRRITESVTITNPELIASNKEAVFKGMSKKGLQGITYAGYEEGSDIVDARNANTKQTLLNLDLSTVVSTTPRTGYVAYPYKGKTYYFSQLDALKKNVQSLNYGYKQYLYGNNGRTPVSVSVCLLLGYNPENSFLIDPAARTPGHSYYMLNVREERARETLEALFLYLGETFGQSQCYVSNWILGNEINSSRTWNYSGSLDFNTYMDCYATAFRMLYTGVKSEKTGNTVSISLDNGWTAAPDTYAGKTTLDTFAQKLQSQNEGIQWSIAYHGYSYPLTRADFWNDYHNTTDHVGTPYISMRNIQVLTNYAAELERSYGKPGGSIRVLLTEQGYSYSAGSWQQAMAIARGYYMAEFNDRIDAFIIRSVIDDPKENSEKLYFGLMNRRQDKRTAFYVYEYMDSDLNKFRNTRAEGTVSPENYGKFNEAKEIVCNTNWGEIIPGFNAGKLAGIK